MRIDIPQIDPVLWLRLSIEARHRGIGVSELLAEVLQQFLGVSKASQPSARTSSLDRLAGTWSKEEAEEFERNTSFFNQVDPELWR